MHVRMYLYYMVCDSAVEMATKTGTSAGSSGVTIPTRKVVVNDPSELPLDYGTTPGGTMFSTTPGGVCVCVCVCFSLYIVY